ncbi:hypothetical protein HZC07_04760, partial [Candidatus Micrarchaeota archaeon]|nr:hypothetical protein [Candidatus Micrarchaeota archaeon]
SLRVIAGYIPKAGEPARLVREAHINANTKSGVIGVLVRLVPPGTVFPDKKTTQVVLPKVIESAAEVSEDRREEKSPVAVPTEDDKEQKRKAGPPSRGPPRGGQQFRPRRRN